MPRALALVAAVLAAGCAAMYAPAGVAVGPASPSPAAGVARESWRFLAPVTVGPGDEVERPTIVHSVPPQYTEEAREQRISGVVELELEVDEQGQVVDIDLLRSLEPGLDANAIAAARQLRYTPARLNGTPRASLVFFTVNFQIK